MVLSAKDCSSTPLEPTLGASEELPHVKDEAVGPMR